MSVNNGEKFKALTQNLLSFWACWFDSGQGHHLKNPPVREVFLYSDAQGAKRSGGERGAPKFFARFYPEFFGFRGLTG